MVRESNNPGWEIGVVAFLRRSFGLWIDCLGFGPKNSQPIRKTRSFSIHLESGIACSGLEGKDLVFCETVFFSVSMARGVSVIEYKQFSKNIYFHALLCFNLAISLLVFLILYKHTK